VDPNDDFRFFHDSDNGGVLTDFGSQIDIPWTNTYVFSQTWFGDLFGIGAYDAFDNFKISSLSVSFVGTIPSAVPLPGGLPLLATALGLMGVIRLTAGRRRRRRAG